MLSEKNIQLVSQTLPVLENTGITLSEHFYQRLFRNHPELKHVFNLSNQTNGRQQFALSAALASYVRHLQDLQQLAELVERVAQKHSSFMIQPEQYDILGFHLLETLRDLAPESFTPEILEAWAQAYSFLASLLSRRETEIYLQNCQRSGGWTGTREFVITGRAAESATITSFILKPADGGPIMDYRPGQYLGIRVTPPGAEYREIRQYSLSDRPNGSSYRISVKREADSSPAGIVSLYLHDILHPGDRIEVMASAGSFCLDSASNPLVLISAGVGITPLMSMLESTLALQPARTVFFLHASHGPEVQAFGLRLEQLQQQHTQLYCYCWYRQAPEKLPFNAFSGWMELSVIAAELPVDQGHYYLCGPLGFMGSLRRQLLRLGICRESIHYEVFGPHADF